MRLWRPSCASSWQSGRARPEPVGAVAAQRVLDAEAAMQAARRTHNERLTANKQPTT